MSQGFGPHLHSAGRCFMYLRWLESRMQDFLCIDEALKRGESNVLRIYNEMHTAGKDFAEHTALVMSKLADHSLGKLIQGFFKEWPQWKNHNKVSYAFKIIQIHRNAFSHAYMPAFGNYLLFAPDDRTKTLIGETDFPIEKLKTTRPFVLVLPCLHEHFIVDFYKRIKLIDFVCFRQVAKDLGVERYPDLMMDPDWPLTAGVDAVTLAPRSPESQR